jgi:type 1 fimbria pilin
MSATDPRGDKVILESGTGAAASSEFHVLAQSVRLQIYGTFGSDTADLQIKSPSGSWTDVYDSNGQVVLSAVRPQVLVEGAGTYRLDYNARTAAQGASIMETPKS